MPRPCVGDPTTRLRPFQRDASAFGELAVRLEPQVRRQTRDAAPSSARSGSLSVIVYEALDATRAPRANHAPLMTRIQRAIAAWVHKYDPAANRELLRRRLNLCTLRLAADERTIVAVAAGQMAVRAAVRDESDLLG